jgi:hypothetical protein
MRLMVPLYGESIAWRFRDSERLGAWIDSQPWLSSGGLPAVRIVRVSDEVAVDVTVDAIQNAVLLSDSGRTGIEPAVLDSDEVASGFRKGVAVYHRMSLDRSNIELAHSLADRNAVYIVPPLFPQRPDLVDEAEQLLDLVGKLHPAARLCVIFMDLAGAPVGGRYFDLTRGLPATAGDLLSAPEQHLWFQYLHRRTAWETAGEIGLAAELSRFVLESNMKAGDDDRLESLFCQWANLRLEKLGHGFRNEARVHFRQLLTGSKSADELLFRSTFWQPGHIASWSPVPWLARAFLCNSELAANRDFLRNSMLCAPIAQELLTACFLIENRIRGCAQLPPTPPEDADCCQLWGKFTSGAEFTRSLYPSRGPSLPEGPWAFASLGEIFTHEMSRPPNSRWRDDVRQLRNHLAHGHYAGWQALKLARTLIDKSGA